HRHRLDAEPRRRALRARRARRDLRLSAGPRRRDQNWRAFLQYRGRGVFGRRRARGHRGERCVRKARGRCGAILRSGLAFLVVPALEMHLLFAHYVSVNGTPVPDALEPWDGSDRSTEKLNQPIWVQITVPQGTAPATYLGSVTLVADGTPTVIPISVGVANVT